MTWRGRTFLLSSALLVCVVLIVVVANVGFRRSPIVPRGAATEEQLLRAIDEIRNDVSRTEEEINSIIRALCVNYPELRDTEACREVQESDRSKGR